MDQTTVSDGNSFQGTDPDELSALLSTSASLIRTEPRGKIRYSCKFGSIDRLSLVDCSYEGQIQFERKGASDKLLIFFPVVGDAHIGHTKMGSFSTPGIGTIADGKMEGRVEIAGRRRHLLLLLEKADLKQRLANMLERPIRRDVEFYPDINLEEGPGRLLQMLSEAAFSGLTGEKNLQKAPLALTNLTETIGNLVLEALPHNFSSAVARPVSATTPKQLRRAIDYMHAHLSEPIRLEQIAAEASTSTRSLQNMFQRFRNTTPMAFLQELRLFAVRQELLEAPPGISVMELAQKWGFMHAGRFAISYRKKFGELPSQTIRVRIS
ncbi:AraC family transcriptional regulator (plasmid) [Rhizobium sp. CB3090]|uniref:AraC family transcriptional regulator n=1 Tax=Rhizobium sp. CB3090 TaxID=3039156 RepID=UPI0024B1624A|nr:AraC family transcriptional regulator [Rhizobium sp. CB3090]WFU12909.1 AraC family transcriptional regulator [Rhizobium sp. CB3090]